MSGPHQEEIRRLRVRMRELSEAIKVEENMLEAQERILEVHVKAGASKNEEEVLQKVKDSRKRLRIMQDSRVTVSTDLELLLLQSDDEFEENPESTRSTSKVHRTRGGSSRSSFSSGTRTASSMLLKLSVGDSIRVKELEEELNREQMYLTASFNLLSQESTQANKRELLQAQTQYRQTRLRITSLNMEKLRITAKDCDIDGSPEAQLRERMRDLERRTAIEAKVEDAATRMMKMPSTKKTDKSKSSNTGLLSHWGQAHRRLDLLQLSLLNCNNRYKEMADTNVVGNVSPQKVEAVEQPPNLHGTVQLRVNEVKGMLNPRHLNDPSDKCQPFVTLVHTGFHGRKDPGVVGRPKLTNNDASFTEWQWDKATDKSKSMFLMEVDAVKEVEVLVYYSKDQLVGLAHVSLDRIIDGRMHALALEMHPQGLISLDIKFTPPNAPPAVTIKRRYAQRRRPQKLGGRRWKGGRTGDSRSAPRDGWRTLKKLLVSKSKEEKECTKKALKQTQSSPVVSQSKTSEAVRRGDIIEPNSGAMSESDSSDRESPRPESDMDDLIRQREGEGRETEAPSADFALENLCVDAFHFHSVLGMGNFGKVILGEIKDTGVLYALKFIKKEFIISEEEVAAVDIEKRIFMKATQANHPYIAKMYAGFQTESRVCFALEFAGGGDLMYHIHQGIFDEARAQFYSIECFMALEFLHNHGIVYRDLKLDNVLLDREGHVKLADFGLCKENMWDGDRTSTFCGTPEFIAPEILLEDTYTRAVDWWAYGVLVYEMMVGESPFPGEDEEEVFNSVLRENIVYPFFLNRDSSSLLRSLLVRDPESRLGGRGDAKEVKSHAFFKKVDFDKYMARAVPPPFVPQLASPLDLRYFDPEFTALPKKLTVMKPKLTRKDQHMFRAFSFVHKEFYVDRKTNHPIPRDSIKKTSRASYC